MGKEALGCIDELIPHCGGFGKTSATFWGARPSNGSVGKSGTVGVPGSFVRLLQVLSGNTALEHIATLAKKAFTDSAYCQARTRLPLAVYQAILRTLIKAFIPETSNGRWHGHRTFLIDGSSFSMPGTPELQAHFGQPGAQAPGCGFPVAKILALFHAGTGLLLEVMAAPLRSHEMSRVEDIHPALQPGDVLVADRGFCSFALISRCSIGAACTGCFGSTSDRSSISHRIECMFDPAPNVVGKDFLARAGFGGLGSSTKSSSGSSLRASPIG